MSIRERILDTVAEKAQMDRSAVNDNTLIAALLIDSLAFMDLVMQIEDAENIDLSDGEVDQILTSTKLGEIAAVFEASKAGSAAENRAS